MQTRLRPAASHDGMTFDQWFWAMSELARQEEFELGHKDQYLEYYDDGDSPAEALAEELTRHEESEDFV